MNMGTMTTQERLDWLRLIRSENVGPITFHHLLQSCGSASAALERLPELARKGGRTQRLHITSSSAANEEMQRAEKMGMRMLFLPDAEYPKTLRSLESAPPILYLLGDVKLAAKPCIALVGSRNASVNATKLTRRIAADLSKHDFVIVSGMARGIDASAHWGALEHGTIAVLAGGVDVVYPHSNRILYGKLREHGALLSEMPPGMEPLGRHFPRRNRIISGLCLAVVVMEATMQSGSLITAQMALKQCKEVMAVPGFPSDARSHGTNHLIRNGAKLVETSKDILNALQHLLNTHLLQEESLFSDPPESQPAGEPEDSNDKAREKLLSLIGSAPISIDELVTQGHLPLEQTLLLLVELELSGQIVREPGQRVSRLAFSSHGD